MAAVAEKPEFACFNALSATVSQKDTKMNRFLRLRIAGLAAAAFVLQSGVAIAQPPAMAVVSPEVHPDRTVTFRIPAPNAKQVSVSGEFDRHPVGLTKDDAGVWSVTVGPLKSNGGPVILVQVENEYANVAKRYRDAGQEYLRWIVELAKRLGFASVPSTTCEGGAQGAIETSNGFMIPPERIAAVRKSHPGTPSQRYYHVPADWLQHSNEIVILEEQAASPATVELQVRARRSNIEDGSGVSNKEQWEGICD
jgi:hypothetical protein